MKIWLTRHGQTNLNRAHLMQGRTDEPLNETGIGQARAAREKLLSLHEGLRFDAVYASPLRRAVLTGSIIGGVREEEIRIDGRLIEADFGIYEKKKYWMLSPAMTLYWTLPEYFPAPRTVESTSDMIRRAHGFLAALERMDYENVLVACHGGILRVLCGYMEERPNGLKWRPKPHNCEIRVYESLPEGSAGGGGIRRRYLETILP